MIEEQFMLFEQSVVDTKEAIVAQEGACTNLAPTFFVLRADGRCLMGSCSDVAQRMPMNGPRSTRWLALCRQVTHLTGADVAFAAVEIRHANELILPEGMPDAIEISGITREHSVAILRPYTYSPGRIVDWLPAGPADPNDLNRASAIELDGARLAWQTPGYASSYSVKYLSSLCGVTWIGHPTLISDILGIN